MKWKGSMICVICTMVISLHRNYYFFISNIIRFSVRGSVTKANSSLQATESLRCTESLRSLRSRGHPTRVTHLLHPLTTYNRSSDPYRSLWHGSDRKTRRRCRGMDPTGSANVRRWSVCNTPKYRNGVRTGRPRSLSMLRLTSRSRSGHVSSGSPCGRDRGQLGESSEWDAVPGFVPMKLGFAPSSGASTRDASRPWTACCWRRTWAALPASAPSSASSSLSRCLFFPADTWLSLTTCHVIDN